MSDTPTSVCLSKTPVARATPISNTTLFPRPCSVDENRRYEGISSSSRVAQRNTGEIEKGRWLVVMLKPGEKRGNAPLEFLIRPFNGCRFEMPAIIIDDGWLKNRGCRGNNEADPFIISLGKNWRKRLLWRREGNINWNWICRYIFMQLVVVEKMDLLCSFPKNLNLEFKIWNWSKNIKNGKNLLSRVKR